MLVTQFLLSSPSKIQSISQLRSLLKRQISPGRLQRAVVRRSSSPLMMVLWLTLNFRVIMLTDDEKYFHSPKLTLEEVHDFALQNAADIIAIG